MTPFFIAVDKKTARRKTNTICGQTVMVNTLDS